MMSKAAVIVALMIVIAVVAGAYYFVVLNAEDGKDTGEELDHDNHHDPVTLSDGDLSIHFLELGNKFTGDCVYIKYGDIDILIDAGSRTSSAPTITKYLNMYVTDGTLEYVIATHAHQDHIAGFYSTNTTTGVLDSFTVGTIIDYPRTDSTTATRNNYENTVNKLVANGTEHYTALDCYKEINGGKRIYDLGGGVELEILYQPFYEKKASAENDYSVCVMIKQGVNQYLFTGDLEKAGELGLVNYYDENHGGLGHCVLYKGGHHGSSTSSNAELLSAITPEYVIICTCAGTSEYSSAPSGQFPTQTFINRVAPYTDKVYVTTVILDYGKNSYRSLNGDIVFMVSSGGEIKVICSGDSRVLKETDWFKNNRTMPAAWA